MKCLKCGKELRASRCECGFDCLEDRFLSLSLMGEYFNGFRDKKIHTVGTLTQKNGEYTGELLNGVPCGKGSYKWANGDVYEGDFSDGKFNGKGIYRWANGDVYDGEFLNDKRHGKGVHKYSFGTKYEGTWVNNKMHGYGVYWHSNGDKYEGQWLNGEKHGQGTMTYADGKVVKGEWKNNELVNSNDTYIANNDARADANGTLENKKADIEALKKQIARWKSTHFNETEANEMFTRFITEDEKHLARLENDIRKIESLKFMMPVMDVFEITGRGVTVVGRVEVGTIKIGDAIEIILEDGKKISSTVTQIEMYHKTLDHAQVGDNVGIGLKGVKKNDVVNAQAIVNRGADVLHKTFNALIHLHEKDTKPIFNHYYPGFSFSSPEARIESRGMLTFSDEKKTMIIPGEDAVVNITLDSPCVLHCGMKFGIHEGGNRWVAKGEIISVIS